MSGPSPKPSSPSSSAGTSQGRWPEYVQPPRPHTEFLTVPTADCSILARQVSGLDQVHVVHRPRLLSTKVRSYISADLAKWLGERNIEHVRGAPYHPRTQGKIERWHKTLKKRVLLENYYFPGDLEANVGAFGEHYNHRRYHEDLNNANARRRLFRTRPKNPHATRKDQTSSTIQNRRLQHQMTAAHTQPSDEPRPPLNHAATCLKYFDDGH